MVLQFAYDRPDGDFRVFWPQGLQLGSPIGVRLTVTGPQRAAVLSFESAGGDMLEVPPETTVARLVTDVERARYPGVQLPREECLQAAVNRVFNVFPEHDYEIRLRGEPVFTLRSVTMHATITASTAAAATESHQSFISKASF